MRNSIRISCNTGESVPPSLADCSSSATRIPSQCVKDKSCIFVFRIPRPARAVPRGKAARALIDMLPGSRNPEAHLFHRHAEGRAVWILTNCWRTICADAKLGRPRLHDLRHTAASHAVMSGENLPLVSKLLGHRRHRTTASYAHLADGHLVEAAEKIGYIIASDMKNTDTGSGH